MSIRKKYPGTKEGYIFDTQILRLELYRLLTSIISSEHLDEDSEFCTLIHEFQEDQIIITLLTIATTVRVIDDREDKFLDKLQTHCGKLYNKTNKRTDKKDLSLREACNKIIHAKKIRFEVFDKNSRNRIKPVIHLYGIKDKRKWEASVNILDFIKYAESLIY